MLLAILAFVVGAALMHAFHTRRAPAAEAAPPGNSPMAEHAELAALAAASMFKVSRGLQTELARAREEVCAERERSETLSTEARTDKLTDLPNRRVFDEELQHRIDVWKTTRQKPVSLMLIDVDHFKQLNDRYGHDAGDAALQWLARKARAHVGEAGLAVRYGGEEFAVIVSASQPVEAAVELAEKVRLAIAAEPFQYNGLSLPITASVGLAASLVDEGGKPLARRADEALYAAKRNGRNRVYLHDGFECIPFPIKAAPAEKGRPMWQKLTVPATTG